MRIIQGSCNHEKSMAVAKLQPLQAFVWSMDKRVLAHTGRVESADDQKGQTYSATMRYVP